MASHSRSDYGGCVLPRQAGNRKIWHGKPTLRTVKPPRTQCLSSGRSIDGRVKRLARCMPRDLVFLAGAMEPFPALPVALWGKGERSFAKHAD
jgi:hypothetical protein